MSSFLNKLKRKPSAAKTMLNEKVNDLESAKAKLEEDVEKYKSEVEGYKTDAENYKKQAEEVKVEAEEKVKVAKEEVETVKKEAEETKAGLMDQIATWKQKAEEAMKMVAQLKQTLAGFTGEGGGGDLAAKAGGALKGGISQLGF